MRKMRRVSISVLEVTGLRKSQKMLWSTREVSENGAQRPSSSGK